jgi:DNA-binding transcriptional regulator LsrR (DeoR family)
MHNNDNEKNSENRKESLVPTTNMEQENRQAKVLALHSKGLTQLEIAEHLGVDQSTVSRDLHHIREESRKYIEAHVTKNIPFEFNRYLAGLDQITKKLWEITMTEKDKVGDQTTTTTTTTTNKVIMAALTLLIQCYNKRLEILVGGPESNMNAKKHISDIKQKEKIRKDPFLKSMMDPYSLEE